MKRVVSVSLGTRKRDKTDEVELLGEQVLLERRGTDGDRQAFAALFTELDGKVDALGVGGADIWIVIENQRYEFRQIRQLIAGAKTTPVVDGSGLKHTLEREAVHRIQRDGIFDFRERRVLLVSAVDRFGMAQALEQVKANVTYGDLLFGLGLNIPLRSYAQVVRLGRVIAPIITKLPLQWFYPTGEKQEQRSPKFARYFQDADLICGDWHFIHRYAPDRLEGKTILTQTLRTADLDWLRSTGAARAIVTTPVIGGETFATNVMEGAVVALLGKSPEQITEADYMDVLARLNWAPTVMELG